MRILDVVLFQTLVSFQERRDIAITTQDSDDF